MEEADEEQKRRTDESQNPIVGAYVTDCPGFETNTVIAFTPQSVQCLDLDNDSRVVSTYPFVHHNMYPPDALDGSISEYRLDGRTMYKAGSGKEKRLLQCSDNAKPRMGAIDQNETHLFLGMDTSKGPDGGLPLAVYSRNTSIV